MAALRAFEGHQGVQQWALMSVGNLCNASEARKRALMDLGLGEVGLGSGSGFSGVRARVLGLQAVLGLRWVVLLV